MHRLAERLDSSPRHADPARRPPVFTAGRRAKDDGLLGPGVVQAHGGIVRKIDRGSNRSFRTGPAHRYPIIDLRNDAGRPRLPAPAGRGDRRLRRGSVLQRSRRRDVRTGVSHSNNKVRDRRAAPARSRHAAWVRAELRHRPVVVQQDRRVHELPDHGVTSPLGADRTCGRGRGRPSVRRACIRGARFDVSVPRYRTDRGGVHGTQADAPERPASPSVRGRRLRAGGRGLRVRAARLPEIAVQVTSSNGCASGRDTCAWLGPGTRKLSELLAPSSVRIVEIDPSPRCGRPSPATFPAAVRGAVAEELHCGRIADAAVAAQRLPLVRRPRRSRSSRASCDGACSARLEHPGRGHAVGARDDRRDRAVPSAPSHQYSGARPSRRRTWRRGTNAIRSRTCAGTTPDHVVARFLSISFIAMLTEDERSSSRGPDPPDLSTSSMMSPT